MYGVLFSPANGINNKAGQDWMQNFIMATVAIPPTTDGGNTLYTGTVCEGGIYKSTNAGGSATWQAMTSTVIPNGHHHFHYVMRLAAHPTTPLTIYATDNDSVYFTQDGGGTWAMGLDTRLISGLPGIHLHGLAIAPSNPNNILYVGTGHGNWGDDPAPPGFLARIWRARTGGTTTSDWREITGTDPLAMFPQPDSTKCIGTTSPPTQSGCFSLYSIAVAPKDQNVVYVGTFGSENDPGKPMAGTGIGPVCGKTTDGGNTFTWTTITNGLCDNSNVCDLTKPPSKDPNGTPPKSLYVGEVAITNFPNPATINDDYVFIATLNGIYSMKDPVNGPAWTDISPSNTPALCSGGLNCRAFESIAIDPNDPTGNTIYAGTSEQPGQSPRIFKSTNRGQAGSWIAQALPPTTPSIMWTDRYRVRDIQLRSALSGQPKGYAVVEGAGIYKVNKP